MTVQTALDQGTKLLEEATVIAPRLTAEVLLSHALGRERVYLYAHPEHELNELEWLHYGRYLHQRLEGKPTQYITKHQEFYGRDFHVTPDVLIPRPETEHVVERALELMPRPSAAVDVGCGSGAIAVTLSVERRQPVWATDLSASALAVAENNNAKLGGSVIFVRADLLEPFRAQSMDLVVSNPPYVPQTDKDNLQREVRDYEPHLALFAGPTGNEIYERLIRQSEIVLRPGGWLVMELGYLSWEPVRAMLGRQWTAVEAREDLSGIPRVLSARLWR
jgi:release factor glutamine methyltransferase